MQTETVPTAFQDIPILELVESRWNPRRHYNQATLDELAESIRGAGVIEPIVVRPVEVEGTKRFEILAGSRRFRASKIAELDTIPAVIRDVDDLTALKLATIENLQREDVHPLDEALGYHAFLRAAKKAHNVASLAALVGKSESYVYRRLRLLELEEDLQKALAEDRLDLAHAELLLQLDPKARAEAADPESGVVWQESHLFSDADALTYVPQRADLRPLHELKTFIRTRSHFDPGARDLKHFQPELAAAIEESRQEPLPSDQGSDPHAAQLVELTLDPMARMKLGAGPNDPVPLTPAHWREVKTAKDRCSFTVRGVITHGGEGKLLEVCTKRSCAKHWDQPKKAKAASGAKAKSSRAAEEAARKATEQRQVEERKLAEQEWKELEPALCTAFAAHTAKLKLTAAVVKNIVDSYVLKGVEKAFGLKLTDATALQVLVLARINLNWRSYTEQNMTSWGFDVKGFTKQWRDARAADGKAKLAESREQLKTKSPKKGGRK